MCSYIDIDVKTYINDTNTMFKLCFDTNLEEKAQFYGQQMFGTDIMRNDGNETPFQKWCGLKDNKNSVISPNAWKFPSKYYYAWGTNFYLNIQYKF